ALFRILLTSACSRGTTLSRTNVGPMATLWGSTGWPPLRSIRTTWPRSSSAHACPGDGDGGATDSGGLGTVAGPAEAGGDGAIAAATTPGGGSAIFVAAGEVVATTGAGIAGAAATLATDWTRAFSIAGQPSKTNLKSGRLSSRFVSRTS